MISLVDYKKSVHSSAVISLFRKIYPDWNSGNLNRIVYDENNPLHIMTKLVYLDMILIGQVNIFKIYVNSIWLNIGYHLDPNYHGMGLGKEMVNKSIIDLTDTLIIQTTKANIPSRRIAITLGFNELQISDIPNIILPFMKFTKLHNGIGYIKYSAQQGDAAEPAR